MTVLIMKLPIFSLSQWSFSLSLINAIKYCTHKSDNWKGPFCVLLQFRLRFYGQIVRLHNGDLCTGRYIMSNRWDTQYLGEQGGSLSNNPFLAAGSTRYIYIYIWLNISVNQSRGLQRSRGWPQPRQPSTALTALTHTKMLLYGEEE